MLNPSSLIFMTIPRSQVYFPLPPIFLPPGFSSLNEVLFIWCCLEIDLWQVQWFPGPLLAHRDKGKMDYSFLWQASKRENGSLKGLKAIGTDEDSALMEGILEETDGQTIHLLGKEHVQQNVAKKLAEYNFPERQKRRI